MSKKTDGDDFIITGREAVQEVSQEEASSTGLQSEDDGPQLPCIVNGAMAGLSGGALGYLFGFGGKLLRHRGKGRWKACTAEGWSSAKSFAMFGSVYTFVSCIAQRLRQKQDALNGGIAGGATGLALGWSGGPISALQSCVMLGLFSYVVDYLQMQSAEAAPRDRRIRRHSQPANHQSQARRRGSGASISTPSALLSPALPWWHGQSLPCEVCMACPLVMPPAVQQQLHALKRHVNNKRAGS